MQYRLAGGTWINTGSEMKRTMSSTSDQGAVTLYALEEGLPPGTYEVQLVGKSETGETVETLNGTLAAVALSYTNATGGGYFDGFAVKGDSLSDGVQTTLSLGALTNGVFSSMSFVSSASQGANNTGAFSLHITNSLTSVSNQENLRFFEDATDAGSGASAGYLSALDPGDYTLYGQADNVSGPITTSSVTMVGFSTESIPEPAVITLLGAFGGLLLISRRIFKSS